MAANSSLRTRIVLWLGGYTLLLSLAVLANGYAINEHAEQVVWRSLMESELDHFIERRQANPGYEWRNTHDLKLYGAGYGSALPASLQRLGPGLYDEVKVDGREWIALVRDTGGQHLVMILDITPFETREMRVDPQPTCRKDAQHMRVRDEQHGMAALHQRHRLIDGLLHLIGREAVLARLAIASTL